MNSLRVFFFKNRSCYDIIFSLTKKRNITEYFLSDSHEFPIRNFRIKKKMKFEIHSTAPHQYSNVNQDDFEFFLLLALDI